MLLEHIKVTSKIKEEGIFTSWDSENKHNKFSVRVRNIITNKSVIFDYFGSVQDYNNCKVEMTHEENMFALYCILNDGLSGSESFEIFCDNFGYNTDSIKDKKIYKECMKSNEKLQRIEINNSNMYDLVNELSEKGYN